MGDARLAAMDAASEVHTPAYVVDEAKLLDNCRILKDVQTATGCKILLAQKAFSMFAVYPLIAPYLAGTTASGLYEARLGREHFPGEVHVYEPAYRAADMPDVVETAGFVYFNSLAQLDRYGHMVRAAGKQVGLRIDPQCSTQDHAIYDPCAPGSRLGTTRAQWDRQMTEPLVALLDGLHFHTLCEQDADDLETTLQAVAERFGDVLPRMRWLNFGGGHHITRPGYDLARLERCIRRAQEAWGVTVYLEPGEAWALNAGFLAARVLDLVENAGVQNAILDASAACHMPDVIEMPYQPPVYAAQTAEQAGQAAETSHRFRLGGPTCLAGDVIGDYVFPAPLREGDLVLFGDLAIYSTCKNNTFNGMPLPDLWLRRADGSLCCLTAFGYEDFKGRLGSRA